MKSVGAALLAGSLLTIPTLAVPVQAQSPSSALTERDKQVIRLAWQAWDDNWSQERERIDNALASLFDQLQAALARHDALERQQTAAAASLQAVDQKLQTEIGRLAERIESLPDGESLHALVPISEELRADVRELQRLPNAVAESRAELKSNIERDINSAGDRLGSLETLAETVRRDVDRQRRELDEQTDSLRAIHNLQYDWPGSRAIADLESRAGYLMPALIVIGAALLINAVLALRPRDRRQIDDAVSKAMEVLKSESPRRSRARSKKAASSEPK